MNKQRKRGTKKQPEESKERNKIRNERSCECPQSVEGGKRKGCDGLQKDFGAAENQRKGSGKRSDKGDTN